MRLNLVLMTVFAAVLATRADAKDSQKNLAVQEPARSGAIACGNPTWEEKGEIKNCLAGSIEEGFSATKEAMAEFKAMKIAGFPVVYFLKKGVGYVLPDGKIVRMHWIDNGPDYFNEGLARYLEGSKIGFVDEKLNVVIPAQFEYVDSFENGKARHCKDVVFEAMGEHTAIKSGTCAYIDKKGQPLKDTK